MSDEKSLAKIVHEGTVLRPLGDLRIEIHIDPAVIKRAAESVEHARRSLAGFATRVSSLNWPDERNIIDQD